MKHEGNCSTADDSNGILLQPRKNSTVRLQIVPAQPKTITHLPKRPPVDLAFTDLTYKVREGRKNSEYIFISIYYRYLINSIKASVELFTTKFFVFTFDWGKWINMAIRISKELSVEKEEKVALIAFFVNCCNISCFWVY